MKRTVAGLLAVLLCIVSMTVAQAYDTAAEHWRDMNVVLFGEKNYILGKPEKVRNAVWKLRYASQLCIDQFGGDNGKAQLKRLHSLKTPGAPKSISEIALYPLNNNHREYTHQGWKYNYHDFNDSRNPDWSTKRWPKRKKLLLSTAENIFNFNGLPDFFDIFVGVNEKCDSFCALLYYVHISGDHIGFNQSTYASGKGEVMPLAGTRDDSIISELIECLEVLFPNQNYSEMQRKLETADMEIIKLLNDPDILKTEEGFQKYHDLAFNIINDILAKHLPGLLKNEDFFKKVFY